MTSAAVIRFALRMAAVIGVLLAVLLTGVWLNRMSWAAGMLVMAPAPRGGRLVAPPSVTRRLEVPHGSAVIRAWIFEPQIPVRGTLLMLHGIRDNKLSLVTGAQQHAARGWRVVAVDARGHGESSGQYLTYGVEESRDLVALVDRLEADRMLVAPLAVVGTSYGAAIALQYAAIDPRVARVAALAPFASLRTVVPAYLAWWLGRPARWLPRSIVNELIDGAARRAGFDPDLACPVCVAPRIRAAVLLVHSRDDERNPFQHSVQIRDALQTRARLMLIDGVDHLHVGDAPGVRVAVADWIDGDVGADPPP